mgnify:CR=1 FL=1
MSFPLKKREKKNKGKEIVRRSSRLEKLDQGVC